MNKFSDEEKQAIYALFDKCQKKNYMRNTYRWEGFAIGLTVGILASWFISYMGW